MIRQWYALNPFVAAHRYMYTPTCGACSNVEETERDRYKPVRVGAQPSKRGVSDLSKRIFCHSAVIYSECQIAPQLYSLHIATIILRELCFFLFFLLKYSLQPVL